jgi:hypothetical protein
MHHNIYVILHKCGGESMGQLERLEERRLEIIGKIAKIPSMRKGSLSATTRRVTLRDGSVAQRGPYWSLSRKDAGGKTTAETVRPEDLEGMREEVGNYRAFRDLADEYAEVCDGISRLSAGTLGAKKNS